MQNIIPQQKPPTLRELMPFATNENPCKFCKIINSPPYFYGPPPLESIRHVLTSCPKYHELRSNLSEPLKSFVIRADYKIILKSCQDMLTEFQLYISNCIALRN